MGLTPPAETLLKLARKTADAALRKIFIVKQKASDGCFKESIYGKFLAFAVWENRNCVLVPALELHRFDAGLFAETSLARQLCRSAEGWLPPNNDMQDVSLQIKDMPKGASFAEDLMLFSQ